MCEYICMYVCVDNMKCDAYLKRLDAESSLA